MTTIGSNKEGLVRKPVGNEALTPGADSALVSELSEIFCAADLPFMVSRIMDLSSEMTVVDPPELEGRSQEQKFVEPSREPEFVSFFNFIKGKIQQIYPPEQIETRVKQLGEEISRDYANCRRPLVVIGVLNGCSPFLTDLLRAMSDSLPMEVDFVRASFYGNQTIPSSSARLYERCNLPLEDKEVLIVDDILDTGKTMNSVIESLYEMQPYRIKGCVCVERKREHRPRVPEVRYRGFEIEEGWGVGYGMDYQQYFRNLPYIGVMNTLIAPEEP